MKTTIMLHARCARGLLVAATLLSSFTVHAATSGPFPVVVGPVGPRGADATPTTYVLHQVLSDGSFVCIVDASGQHGLLMSRRDYFGFTPLSASIGTWYDAKFSAESLGAGRRVPTSTEWTLIRANNDLLGANNSVYLFTNVNAGCWSSTQQSANGVWAQAFWTSGPASQIAVNTTGPSVHYIRSVRSF